MDDLVSVFLLPVFSLVVLLFCSLAAHCKLKWVLWSFLYLCGYSFVLSFIPTPSSLKLHYNWLGKLLAICYSCAAAWIMRLKPDALGVRLPRTWRSTTFGVVAALVYAAVAGYIFRHGRYPGSETLLYQATMPGLDEELAFRGVLFACLVRCFGSRRQLWPVCLTALIFGFGHGVTYSAYRFHFETVSFVYTAGLGLLLGAMRSASGSLLGPLLAHNGANVGAALSSWLPRAPGPRAG